jgi:hypothetical protein
VRRLVLSNRADPEFTVLKESTMAFGCTVDVRPALKRELRSSGATLVSASCFQRREKLQYLRNATNKYVRSESQIWSVRLSRELREKWAPEKLKSALRPPERMQRHSF